ncbi:MAG: SET domain-containing protein-lysine N-methyltransferase [Chitinophagaceae bacterium]|nr:SET domain-containing protein-lysine N-methyltransferase [Chitinophagaceae bacterium]
MLVTSGLFKILPVNTINYLNKSIYIKQTTARGRGVFARTVLKSRTLIEIAPVIVMGKTERNLLDQTSLHDYIFEWGVKKDQCCMALGYVPLYNHSYRSNCEYEMDFKLKVIHIRTVRKINAGEELFINYNGVWNDDKPLWFDAQ